MKALKLEAGEYMDSKEELLEAIEHYDVLTKAQRKILKSLIEVEIDGKSVISVKSLAKMGNISKTSAYETLNLLNKMNVIETLNSTTPKLSTFLLKKSKLEEIKYIVNKTKNAIMYNFKKSEKKAENIIDS